MSAFSTVAVLTVLTATTPAIATQTQEQLSPQSRPVPVPTAASSSYQHQDFKVFAAFSEVDAKSGATSCEPKRATTQGTATSTAFAATATQDGMTEVALAGLALRKSRNSQVRELAQKMVQDYAQSNGGLNSIVKCEGLILPIGLDAKHNALVKSLDAKSGKAFDNAYLGHLVDKHSEAVALFESASRSGDSDVAAFARKGLSMLQEHQLLADNLRAAIGIKISTTH